MLLNATPQHVKVCADLTDCEGRTLCITREVQSSVRAQRSEDRFRALTVSILFRGRLITHSLPLLAALYRQDKRWPQTSIHLFDFLLQCSRKAAAYRRGLKQVVAALCSLHCGTVRKRRSILPGTHGECSGDLSLIYLLKRPYEKGAATSVELAPDKTRGHFLHPGRALRTSDRAECACHQACFPTGTSRRRTGRNLCTLNTSKAKHFACQRSHFIRSTTEGHLATSVL